MARRAPLLRAPPPRAPLLRTLPSRAPLPRSPPPLAPLVRAPPPLAPLLVLLLVLLLVSTADALETVDQAPELTCSEGLTDCLVTEVTFYRLPYEDQGLRVDVGRVDIHVLLCCSRGRECEPCLHILLEIQGVGGQQEKQDSVPLGERGSEDEGLAVRPQEGSGVGEPSNPSALVTVCLSSPGVGYCKTLAFRPDRRFGNDVPEHKLWLVLTEEAVFGSPVVVQVRARSTRVYNVTVPSLREVCHLHPDADVKDCHAPRLQVVSDGEADEILLRLDVADSHSETVMFQKFWDQVPGEVLEWPKGQRELRVGTHAVAPCLCFQVWWSGKPLRRESCPFKNLRGIIENMQNNVSVSLSVAPVRNYHGSSREAAGLTWSVTAPCRLEGEVWLCKKDFAVGGCEEVTGSRQSLFNHTKGGWRATANGHWKEGQFMNMSPHPALCMQVRLHGAHSNLEPHCPFAAPRWRWSMLAVVSLLLLCGSVLGAYFVQGLLKGYAWRWFKEGNVKGLVAGSHVVLLHQADGQQALPVLLSRLGSSLRSLGFSVSLDLWSQTELGMLGPVPWLHAQLDQVQRQGGKVVLVLTQASWAKADEWGGQGWERGGARSREEGGEKEEEEEGGKGSPVTSQHVDAFSASLSCVLADYMQGRAGERFLLVQFESLPPQAPGSRRPLPELFRGLYLHCLPSQSLAFLTDLAGGRPGSSASARREKACRLRAASRVLARGLTGAGATMLRLAGLPQDCVGKVEEDTWETVPLQPYNPTTPPSSPDTDPKEGGLGWV